MKLQTSSELSVFTVRNSDSETTLDLPSAGITLTLNSDETEHLNAAMVASYELYETANAWAQNRLRNMITAHKIFYRFLRNEGYMDEFNALTEKAFHSPQKLESLADPVDDAFAEYRAAMVGLPSCTRDFIDRMNRNRKMSDAEDLKTGVIDLDEWGFETKAYRTLEESEKKERYNLEPIKVTNAATLIGFVKPEVTFTKVMKLKIGSITTEIKGADVNALYESFLSLEQFELFMAGYDVWATVQQAANKVNDFYNNLQKIDYSKDFLAFKTKEPIDTIKLAEFLTEHEQLFSNRASLGVLVRN